MTETKSTSNRSELRTTGEKKIVCGEKHFKALENGIEHFVATTLEWCVE